MRIHFNCVAAVALIVPTPLIAAPVVDAAGLEAAIEQSHRALHAILNGDPKLYEAPFADRDDVTLGNPFGPYAKGTAAVAKTLAGAAAKYRDGEVIAVDRVAVYADNRLAVIVEVEHDRAKIGTRTALADFSARVTSAYEYINGKWLLVHRHADPITSPRPAESVLSKQDCASALAQAAREHFGVNVAP